LITSVFWSMPDHSGSSMGYIALVIYPIAGSSMISLTLNLGMAIVDDCLE
jgi:hypothetical protein